MPARLIRNAKAALQDQAAGLNPAIYAQYEREIHEAEARARHAAERELAKRLDQIDAQRVVLVREACDVRDELQELFAETEVGRLGAADYRRRLDALAARKAAVETREAELTRQAGLLDELEDAPAEWFDRLNTSYPSAGTTPEFSF